MADLQLIVSGLAVGGIYALLALSYALVYRSTRAINFAQGDFAALGAFVAFALAGSSHVGIFAILGGIAFTVVLSVVVERLAFRPLYKTEPIYVIVSSIALVFVLQGTMQKIWGSRGRSIDPLIGGSLHIGGLFIPYQYVVILGVVAIVTVALLRFFRTKYGIAMRASAENADVAALLGVSRSNMTIISYSIAGALTGLAGALAAPTTLLSPTTGGTIGLIALIAAIVGGLGNFTGALVAGMGMGLVQSFTSYYVGGGYVTIVLFAVLVLILVVKPSGIFGEEGMKVRS